MAQSLIFSFHDRETSRKHNNRFARVLQDGIYSGFQPRMAAGSSKEIDLTVGLDDLSRALTKEGVLVIESAPLLPAVVVGQPDAVNSRWDLLVVEYEFSANQAQTAIYKLVEGAPAVEPIRPGTENDFQVPIAYVRVTPDISGGSPRIPSVADTDLFPVQHADLVNGSPEIGDLAPSIADGSRRLFVNDGMFPNSNGTEVLTFAGGYTDEIPNTVSETFHVYGLTDNLELTLIESVATLSSISSIPASVMPIAVVRGTAQGVGDSIIAEVIDLRVIFYRPPPASTELDRWTDHLGNSIFDFMVPEFFLDDTGLRNLGVYELAPADYTFANRDTDFELTIDAVTSELVITYNGAGVQSDDRFFILEDILANSGIVAPGTMQVLAETDIANLSYSLTTSNSPETPGSYLSLDQPIIPLTSAGPIQFATGAPQVYTRIKIPGNTFTASGQERRIASIVFFFGLDPAAGSDVSFVASSISNAIFATNNLIANPLVLWSQNKPGQNADQIPHTLLDSLNLTVINPGDMGPDGWYLLSNTSSVALDLSRPALIGAPPEDSRSAFMEATNSSPSTYELEHRIPFSADLAGRQLTFSASIFTGTPSATVAMSVVGYFRDALGDLQADVLVTSPPFSGAETPHFRVTPVIGNQYLQLGIRFTIVLPGAAAVRILQPNLVIGAYTAGLPYTAPTDLLSRSAGYYERVHIVDSGFAEQSTLITKSVKLARKFTELGPLTVREVANSTGATLNNLGALTVEGSYNHAQVSAQAGNVGPYAMDVEIEAIVVPEIV